MDEAGIRRQVARLGQEHVFAFWGELDSTRRGALIHDLQQVDFKLLAGLIETHVRVAAPTGPPTALEPPGMLPAEPATARQQQ